MSAAPPTLSTPLASLSDEDLAVTAQTVPALRDDAFRILVRRTEGMRRKLTRTCWVSGGYSDEDTLANGLYGLVRAVDTYDRTKGRKFTSHAYMWVRRHSDNRSRDDQPLRDQITRRGRNADKLTKVMTVMSASGTSRGDDRSKDRFFDDLAQGHDDDAGQTLDIREALASLDPETREMITRRFLQHERPDDIAEAFGVCKRTVLARINEGRAKLARLLDGYGGER